MPPSGFGKTQFSRLAQLLQSPMNCLESLSPTSLESDDGNVSIPAFCANGTGSISNSSQKKAGVCRSFWKVQPVLCWHEEQRLRYSAWYRGVMRTTSQFVSGLGGNSFFISPSVLLVDDRCFSIQFIRPWFRPAKPRAAITRQNSHKQQSYQLNNDGTQEFFNNPVNRQIRDISSQIF